MGQLWCESLLLVLLPTPMKDAYNDCMQMLQKCDLALGSTLHKECKLMKNLSHALQ